MKVMKFGGTSVGSVKSILSLKKIVEAEARTQPVIVQLERLADTIAVDTRGDWEHTME